MSTPAGPNGQITLRELYPHYSDLELQNVERRLDDYLALALRILTRIESDPRALAEFEALTASQPCPKIEPKTSAPKPSTAT